MPAALQSGKRFQFAIYAQAILVAILTSFYDAGAVAPIDPGQKQPSLGPQIASNVRATHGGREFSHLASKSADAADIKFRSSRVDVQVGDHRKDSVALIRREAVPSTLVKEEESKVLGPPPPPPQDEPNDYKYKIFTCWDYPNGPSTLVSMNIDTWRAHSPPNTRIVFVNDSNIREWVPDTPKEYFRLPYAAAKSDYVRASVLFHHTGLYMDADFIVLGDLGRVFAKLDEGYDVVTYQDGDGPSHDCGTPSSIGGFSSNFMAARKGNKVSETWWTNVKHKLTRLCDQGEFTVEKVCCHEAYARKPEMRKCHIPWAHLELLKLPHKDPDLQPARRDPTQKMPGGSLAKEQGRAAEAEIQAKVEAGRQKSVNIPNDARLYCFSGPDGMNPYSNGEIYWQAWDSNLQKSSNFLEHESYDKRFDCKADNMDLVCTRGPWWRQTRTFHNFFGIIAFHLFFSTKTVSVKSRKDVFGRSWLLSEMHRRSLFARALEK